VIKVLFIDDDKTSQDTLGQLFRGEFCFIPCLKGDDALGLLAQDKPDVILLDIDLPDTNGLTLLDQITGMDYAPPVIMLTGFSDVKIVVRSIQKGAVDYIVKPFPIDDLKIALIKAHSRSIQTKTMQLNTVGGPLDCITGDSRDIGEVKRLVSIFAKSNIPVFIYGESGTGKDLVARTIHELSPRCNGPYLVKNCGAIPEALIETEIFGCEKGAFTDAVSRPGSFEMANCGTLFLDEIGEMSLSSQVKLLRVLEDNEVVRIGGKKRIHNDVRIITASNKDLGKAVREGSFREDLYYRINILPICTPPLRVRKEDIPVLSHYFLNREHKDKRFTPAALYKLSEHDWPGNIRELKNAISRAGLLAENALVGADHISFV
jgi:DNA-binding NtrC family response regulator